MDGDYLVRAGLSLESVTPQYLKGLRYLGLIAGDGQPTAIANELKVASSDAYPNKLLSVLKNSYTRIFEVVDPSTATKQNIEDAFRYEKPDGRRKRMVACFIALCEAAGVPVPDAERAKRGSDSRARTSPTRLAQPRKQKITIGVNSGARANKDSAELSRLGELPTSVKGVLAALPDVETPEDLENWLAAFKSIFLLAKKA
jgi:hypothetical protein